MDFSFDLSNLISILVIYVFINLILLTIYYTIKLIVIIIKFLFQVLIAYYRYKMEELDQIYDDDDYDTTIESVSNITDIINILNKNILFTNLYNFIFEYKLRHLPKYTNYKDLSIIPKMLTNGKKLEDIDRYIYSVLLTSTNKAKETKNLSFEYFLECVEINISHPLNKYKGTNMINIIETEYEGTNMINMIENEYFQFLCFHDKLNELNCYVYKYDNYDTSVPYLKNNRFYL